KLAIRKGNPSQAEYHLKRANKFYEDARVASEKRYSTVQFAERCLQMVKETHNSHTAPLYELSHRLKRNQDDLKRRYGNEYTSYAGPLLWQQVQVLSNLAAETTKDFQKAHSLFMHGKEKEARDVFDHAMLKLKYVTHTSNVFNLAIELHGHQKTLTQLAKFTGSREVSAALADLKKLQKQVARIQASSTGRSQINGKTVSTTFFYLNAATQDLWNNFSPVVDEFQKLYSSHGKKRLAWQAGTVAFSYVQMFGGALAEAKAVYGKNHAHVKALESNLLPLANIASRFFVSPEQAFIKFAAPPGQRTPWRDDFQENIDRCWTSLSNISWFKRNPIWWKLTAMQVGQITNMFERKRPTEYWSPDFDRVQNKLAELTSHVIGVSIHSKSIWTSTEQKKVFDNYNGVIDSLDRAAKVMYVGGKGVMSHLDNADKQMNVASEYISKLHGHEKNLDTIKTVLAFGLALVDPLDSWRHLAENGDKMTKWEKRGYMVLGTLDLLTFGFIVGKGLKVPRFIEKLSKLQRSLRQSAKVLHATGQLESASRVLQRANALLGSAESTSKLIQGVQTGIGLGMVGTGGTLAMHGYLKHQQDMQLFGVGLSVAMGSVMLGGLLLGKNVNLSRAQRRASTMPAMYSPEVMAAGTESRLGGLFRRLWHEDAGTLNLDKIAEDIAALRRRLNPSSPSPPVRANVSSPVDAAAARVAPKRQLIRGADDPELSALFRSRDEGIRSPLPAESRTIPLTPEQRLDVDLALLFRRGEQQSWG
ncbi:MAG: hypothetical protein ABID61_02525, partial [Candidatus Micrarchaeota archaeon]